MDRLWDGSGTTKSLDVDQVTGWSRGHVAVDDAAGRQGGRWSLLATRARGGRGADARVPLTRPQEIVEAPSVDQAAGRR